MNRWFVPLLVAVAASLLLAGCQQAAPAPTPTKAPAAPTKAAEPTKAPAAPTKAAEPAKAPAAEPTKPAAAPAAPKVAFPEKGKTITIIVGWPAGGGADVGARMLAAQLEKDMGIPVQVVNKPGASGQVGDAEFMGSRPDGYTLLATFVPGTLSVYLDPERKVTWTRKDFQPLALHVHDPAVVAVKADSPFKTLKELLDAAKAKPEGIKMSSAGLMSPAHMGLLEFERVTGTKYTVVQFDGAAPSKTALLGGHVDATINWAADFLPQVKSGDVRILGIMDKERSKFFPNIPTMTEQGVNIEWGSSRGFSAPAAVARDVLDTLSRAFDKAINSDEHKKKAEEAALPLRYMNPQQYAAYWEAAENVMKPMYQKKN